MSHGVETEPFHIPNLARVNEVGVRLFNSPTRFAAAVVVGRHCILEDNVGITTSNIARGAQRSREAILGQLQVLQGLGLVETRQPTEDFPATWTQYYRATNSPIWHVIHQTIQAIGPPDTTPAIEPVTLSVNEALVLQKKFFGKRMIPFVGMYFGNMEDSNQAVSASEFLYPHRPVQARVDSLLNIFSNFAELGMIKIAEGEPTHPDARYVPTEHPLLHTFRALSNIIPEELQPRPV